MTARLLDGQAISRTIRAEIAQTVAAFVEQGGPVPTLAAVQVGEDPASSVYLRNKQKACQRVGIESRLHRLGSETTEAELLAFLDQLNSDQAVHGILVQLPLPAGIREARILEAVCPLKDVDCFHPENVGRLMQGRPRYLPCTPHGVQQILHRSGIEAAGKHVVIVGRSEIVGKPLAALLMQRDSVLGPTAANATVTVCHRRTARLAELTRQADILVAALGRARFFGAEMIQAGAAVVDVGINRTEQGLVGDVDFASASRVAGAITPVPGGVGPLTVTMLLANTLAAAQAQHA